jgi:hypothetical protein
MMTSTETRTTHLLHFSDLHDNHQGSRDGACTCDSHAHSQRHTTEFVFRAT